MPPTVRIIPLKCAVQARRFDLASVVVGELEKNKISLKNEDILVISSKFVALSEGRMVELSRVKTTKEARALSRKYTLRPELAQLVLNESDSVLGGIPGFLLAINQGILAPNAGIDRSNVPAGYAILYPKNPKKTAIRIREKILTSLVRPNNKLGIILSDSRVTPTRMGTVGVAIASAGIRPTIDLRGSRDLFGNKLKVTISAIADQLATAAEICMGESSEAIAIVLIRGVRTAFEKPRNKIEARSAIPADKCLILSGLKNPYKKGN